MTRLPGSVTLYCTLIHFSTPFTTVITAYCNGLNGPITNHIYSTSGAASCVTAIYSIYSVIELVHIQYIRERTMDSDHYTQYIRRQLSHIQYDSKSATNNAHYQLGLLIGIIAQAAVQDNKILDVVKAVLEENSRRR